MKHVICVCLERLIYEYHHTCNIGVNISKCRNAAPLLFFAFSLISSNVFQHCIIIMIMIATMSCCKRGDCRWICTKFKVENRCARAFACVTKDNQFDAIQTAGHALWTWGAKQHVHIYLPTDVRRSLRAYSALRLRVIKCTCVSSHGAQTHTYTRELV